MRKPGHKRGSTLVAVFWLMSILSLAVFTAVRLLYYEVDLVTAQVHGTKARHLAEMGIAIAANPVVERVDPILYQEFEEGLYGFKVEMKSEGTRFNINSLLMKRADGASADKDLLREIFSREFGLEMEVADEIVDALVDWVDGDDFTELNGAEFSDYEEMGYLNRPYNRPFYSLDEMRLVRGMDVLERSYPNWQSWFTIWSGGGLDINEADPVMLAYAAEIPPADAETLYQQVRGPDGIRGNEDDQPFNSSAQALDLLGVPDIQRMIVEPRLTANDPTTRIESTGWSGDIRRRVTLIVRNRTGRPSILERREEMVP